MVGSLVEGMLDGYGVFVGVGATVERNVGVKAGDGRGVARMPVGVGFAGVIVSTACGVRVEESSDLVQALRTMSKKRKANSLFRFL